MIQDKGNLLEQNTKIKCNYVEGRMKYESRNDFSQ